MVDPDVERIEKIIDAVARNDPVVTRVELNNSAEKLTAQLLGRLADALEKNKCVAALELAHCAIGNDGAKRIAAVVAASSTLRSVNLETNNIGTEGFRAIADAVRKNSGALAEIRLANQLQPIGPAVEKELAAAVEANKVLTTCAIAIKDSVARNTIDTAIARNKEALRKARTPSPAPVASTPVSAVAAPKTTEKTFVRQPTPYPTSIPHVQGAPVSHLTGTQAAPEKKEPPKPAAAPKPAPAQAPAKPATTTGIAVKTPETKPTPAPANPATALAGKPAASVATTTATKPAAAPAAAPATKPVTTPAVASPAKPAAAAPAAKPAATAPMTKQTAAPAAASPAKPAAAPASPAPGKTYTYEELLKRPQGVDSMKLETYLSDAEFVTVLKVSKEEFEKMPLWKKQQTKRLAKLF